MFFVAQVAGQYCREVDCFHSSLLTSGVMVLGNAAESMDATKKLVVLVDNATTARALSEMLSKEEDHCECFASGEKAWPFIQDHEPALVLIQHDLKGSENLLRHIRGHPRLREVRAAFLTRLRDETRELV